MWITDIVIKCIPDSVYLKYMYRKIMGKKLNLKNPETFNEKLQWLKLHDRNPEYTKMVDKYEVRQYIKETIGAEYLIPLVGGPWDRFDDIDFSKLPQQFVLKCTHDSGSVAICRDRNKFDIDGVRKRFNRALKGNFFYGGREWPYKNVKPRIIAEKYMEDKLMGELIDYKFYCFNGYVHSVMVCIDRNLDSPKFYFFDRNWRLLRINQLGKKAPSDFSLSKPINIDKMFDFASMLSQGIPHVRVDLYDINSQIYFGEMTFFSDSGFDKNLLWETEIMWGKMITCRGIKADENGRISS